MIRVSGARPVRSAARAQPSLSGPAHLKSLTGLRFLASLHVVLFHAVGPFLPDAPAALQRVAARGYLGVGLFFVLSGFILTYAYRDIDWTARGQGRAFWAARFARVYPVYALSLAVATPFLFADAGRADTGRANHLVASFLMVPTMLQAWTPATWGLWNPPSWSLSVEAFFYLLFPFAAPRLARMPGWRLLGLMALCWVVSAALPTAYSLAVPGPHADDDWKAVATYHPLVRFPEFIAGIALGRVFLRRAQDTADPGLARQVAPAIAGVVAVGVFLGFILGGADLPSEPFGNGLLMPLFAVIVYALASSRLGLGWLLSRPPLVVLGESSYAMYLLHVPIFEWLSATLKRTPWLAQTSPGPWLFWTYLTLVVGGSVVTYLLIEAPARRWLRRALSPARPAASTTPVVECASPDGARALYAPDPALAPR